MICPVCGAENPQSVKFCKRCGASMGLRAVKSFSEITPGKLTGMFWAITILALGGLGLIFGCIIPLVALGLDKDLLMMVAFFGFGTLFGIAALLVRQLSRLVSIVQSNTLQAGSTNTATEHAPQQIPAPPRAVPSVTEHTTRNFDPVYQDQPSRE